MCVCVCECSVWVCVWCACGQLRQGPPLERLAGATQGSGGCCGPQSRLYLNPVNWLKMRYFQNNLHCSFSFLESRIVAKLNFVHRSKMFSYLGNQLSEAERTDSEQEVGFQAQFQHPPRQLSDLEHGWPWPLWVFQIPRPWANALSAASWLLFLLYKARHTGNQRAFFWCTRTEQRDPHQMCCQKDAGWQY